MKATRNDIFFNFESIKHIIDRIIPKPRLMEHAQMLSHGLEHEWNRTEQNKQFGERVTSQLLNL